MLSKFGSLAAGALLMSAAVSLSAGGSAANPADPFNPAAASIVDLAEYDLAQYQGGENRIRGDRRLRNSWDRQRDGRRCSRRSGGCRHFYRGSYYEVPWWTLPVIIGGSIAASRDYDRRDYGSSRHVEWCYDRYRSYNERSNTWVSYSGRVRHCISPYS